MENIIIEDFNINNFDVNSNYSIAASAGTGKTFNIVNIVDKLKNIGVDESEILIVTYTEKAAGELKHRMMEDVAGFDADKAHIGTIHGFCMDTITEFYLTMGLPPGLNVVKDDSMKKLYERFVRDYLYNNDANIKIIKKENKLKELVNFAMNLYLDNNGNIDSSIVSFESNPFYEKLSAQAFKLIGKSNEEIINSFINYNDPNNEELSKKIRLFITKCKEIIDKYPDYSSRLDEISLLLTEIDIKIDTLNNEIKGINGRTQKDLKNIKNDELNSLKESKAFIKAFEDLANSIKNNGNFIINGNLMRSKCFDDYKSVFTNSKAFISDKTRLFKDVAVELYKAWQIEKRQNKWMSFNDMLKAVRNSVLQENSLLVPKLRKKYKYALIDEFQDTNQQQWDIFKTIFLDSNEGNHIIVVGDSKQSIYSFQGADLYVYNQAVNEILSKGGLLRNLPNNYRSSKEVINAYNKLFEMKSFASLNYFNKVGVGNNNLKATFDGETIKGLSIALCKNDIIDNDGNQVSNNKYISPSEYATTIVKMITDFSTINDNGETRLRVTDKYGNERNVSFKDFMILARQRSEFYNVEMELKNAGIPYVKSKDNGLFLGVECNHWIVLINAILKPNFTGSNRNAFKKAMYTKFFGKKLSEISSSYYDIDSTDEMNLMLKWKELANSHSYAELIDSILVDSNIEGILNSLSDMQSLNIFKQIGDYALDYLLSGNTLFDLKNHLTRLSLKESDEDDGDGSIVKKGNDFDCVELMTMHSSKGLAGSIVFVVGGEKQNSNFVSKVGIYHKTDELTGKANAYLTIDEKKYRNERIDEVTRLFYVAHTRAIYHLVLPFYKNNPDVPCNSAVEDLLSNDDNKEFYDEVVYDDNVSSRDCKETITKILNAKMPKDDNKSDKKEEEQINAIKELTKGMKKHIVYKHSYASMSKLKETSNTLDEKLNTNKEGEELEEQLLGIDTSAIYASPCYSLDSPIPIPNKFPKGAAIGTTLHEIFEVFEFTDINKDNNLLDVINERFKANGIIHNLEHDEYVKKIVKNVLNANLPVINGSNIYNDIYFSLKDINNINRKAEAEFNFNIEPALLSNYCNGFIDLLFKRQDYYSILDWKSDTINDNDLLSYNNIDDIKKRVDEHYSIQRVLYSYTLVHWLYDLKVEETLDDVFNKHFGGIYYVFIRGCKEGTPNGIYAQTWKCYKDLEKEFKSIMLMVKRGGLKGGNSDGQ